LETSHESNIKRLQIIGKLFDETPYKYGDHAFKLNEILVTGKIASFKGVEHSSALSIAMGTVVII